MTKYTNHHDYIVKKFHKGEAIKVEPGETVDLETGDTVNLDDDVDDQNQETNETGEL